MCRSPPVPCYPLSICDQFMTKESSPLPLVSIGLPVFNGEQFLEQAIASILDQSYSNLELLISDNCSTDRTERIATDAAGRDSRIRYHRSDVNLGAAPNFNRLVELASGSYFKWAAHDDLLHPQYLETCVKALESDPSLVWAHTRAQNIDDAGDLGELRHWNVDFHSWYPYRRFGDAILVNHECLNVFGVIRTELLRKTGLIGSYIASDRVLLAQLSLMGRYCEVPIVGFFHREHTQRSTLAHKSMRERLTWFNPRAGYTPPNLRLGMEYARSIRQSNIRRKYKAYCYLALARWCLRGGQRF